jgi:PPM family protein phosphatase
MTTLTRTPSSPTANAGLQDALVRGLSASTELGSRTPFGSEIAETELRERRPQAKGSPLQASFASDAGVGRTHNEDALLCRPDLALFCVADGMGGFNAGEVASHIVIETLEKRLSNPALGLDHKSYESMVLSAVNEANAAVLRTSARRPECLGMGTTLTLLWQTPLGALYAHIGDSRLYRIQAGQISRLTRDHVIEILPEVLRGRLNNSDGARKGILTRAIGAEQRVEVDFEWLDAIQECHYLLCSDGLTDAMSDEEISNLLSDLGRDGVSQAAQRLVDRALDCGATDNVSALVVDLG